jgi:hypothetical protein
MKPCPSAVCPTPDLHARGIDVADANQEELVATRVIADRRAGELRTSCLNMLLPGLSNG